MQNKRIGLLTAAALVLTLTVAPAASALPSAAPALSETAFVKAVYGALEQLARWLERERLEGVAEKDGSFMDPDGHTSQNPSADIAASVTEDGSFMDPDG